MDNLATLTLVVLIAVWWRVTSEEGPRAKTWHRAIFWFAVVIGWLYFASWLLGD